MKKTEHCYLYQTAAKHLLKACSELKPDQRAVFIYITIHELMPFDRPYPFLKEATFAKGMREDTSRHLHTTISPKLAKAWTDWVCAFDQIEGINEHSARLLILALLAKLFEQVRDEDYKKRKVSPRSTISPFHPAANNKYAL